MIGLGLFCIVSLMTVRKVAHLKKGDVVKLSYHDTPVVVESVELEHNWLMEPLYYVLTYASVNPDATVVLGLNEEVELM